MLLKTLLVFNKKGWQHHPLCPKSSFTCILRFFFFSKLWRSEWLFSSHLLVAAGSPLVSGEQQPDKSWCCWVTAVLPMTINNPGSSWIRARVKGGKEIQDYIHSTKFHMSLSALEICLGSLWVTINDLKYNQDVPSFSRYSPILWPRHQRVVALQRDLNRSDGGEDRNLLKFNFPGWSPFQVPSDAPGVPNPSPALFPSLDPLQLLNVLLWEAQNWTC